MPVTLNGNIRKNMVYKYLVVASIYERVDLVSESYWT